MLKWRNVGERKNRITTHKLCVSERIFREILYKSRAEMLRRTMFTILPATSSSCIKKEDTARGREYTKPNHQLPSHPTENCWRK